MLGVSTLNNIAYFDNAATTFPKPEEVYVFMDNFYREYGVNVGRGQHKLASRASALVFETRTMLCELLHCPNKKVILTHTATEALNIILRGISLSNGYNIYISPFEHNAVTRVISYLSNNYKLNIQTLAFDKTTFTYNLEKIKDQFSDVKPNIVVISHASNVCGVLAPIHKICDISKAYGAINVIDMCQTAGLIDTDLSSENIDFAVFAGHKTLYGPLGVAGFIYSGQIGLDPLIYGGTGTDSQNQSMPDTIPERYEVGSSNIHAISGLYAALKWIKKIDIKKIHEIEQQNRRNLIEILSNYSNIRILPPTDTNAAVGVVSCVFDQYAADDIGRILDGMNIAVRVGLHCAPHAHKFLGTFPVGTVRFSVSYFNTEEDFDKLNDALEIIQYNI
jgi:cysteine desulfurase family protein